MNEITCYCENCNRAEKKENAKNFILWVFIFLSVTVTSWVFFVTFANAFTPFPRDSVTVYKSVTGNVTETATTTNMFTIFDILVFSENQSATLDLQCGTKQILRDVSLADGQNHYDVHVECDNNVTVTTSGFIASDETTIFLTGANRFRSEVPDPVTSETQIIETIGNVDNPLYVNNLSLGIAFGLILFFVVFFGIIYFFKNNN